MRVPHRAIDYFILYKQLTVIKFMYLHKLRNATSGNTRIYFQLQDVKINPLFFTPVLFVKRCVSYWHEVVWLKQKQFRNLFPSKKGCDTARL